MSYLKTFFNDRSISQNFLFVHYISNLKNSLLFLINYLLSLYVQNDIQVSNNIIKLVRYENFDVIYEVMLELLYVIMIFCFYHLFESQLFNYIFHIFHLSLNLNLYESIFFIIHFLMN